MTGALVDDPGRGRVLVPCSPDTPLGQVVAVAEDAAARAGGRLADPDCPPEVVEPDDWPPSLLQLTEGLQRRGIAVYAFAMVRLCAHCGSDDVTVYAGAGGLGRCSSCDGLSYPGRPIKGSGDVVVHALDVALVRALVEGQAPANPDSWQAGWRDGALYVLGSLGLAPDLEASEDASSATIDLES